MTIERRGMMFVLSSPSGAGKSTLARRILGTDPRVELSVSVTTRPARPGEENGRDYHFIDRATFETMAAEGALLEYAEVFGNGYGTPAAPVEEALSRGRDVLFDIDWQGARQLAERARDDLVRVFILPPSMAELAERLRLRGQDAEDVVSRRMARAADEIGHWPEYDFVIVNRDLDESERQVRSILEAERLRRTRQTGLKAFVRKLNAERTVKA